MLLKWHNAACLLCCNNSVLYVVRMPISDSYFIFPKTFTPQMCLHVGAQHVVAYQLARQLCMQVCHAVYCCVLVRGAFTGVGATVPETHSSIQLTAKSMHKTHAND